MKTVKLNKDFRVTLLKELRRVMKLKPGMKVVIFTYGKRMEVMPIEPLDSTFGIAKGINTKIDREPDRDL